MKTKIEPEKKEFKESVLDDITKLNKYHNSQYTDQMIEKESWTHNTISNVTKFYRTRVYKNGTKKQRMMGSSNYDTNKHKWVLRSIQDKYIIEYAKKHNVG